MKDQDNEDRKPPVDNAHVAAMEALTHFVSEYEPASIDEADTFYTTNEILLALQEHTGKLLEPFEVYNLMNQMGYKYQAINGLEFNWLLKRE